MGMFGTWFLMSCQVKLIILVQGPYLSNQPNMILKQNISLVAGGFNLRFSDVQWLTGKTREGGLAGVCQGRSQHPLLV